jgi:hypothetical protein
MIFSEKIGKMGIVNPEPNPIRVPGGVRLVECWHGGAQREFVSLEPINDTTLQGRCRICGTVYEAKIIQPR